EEWGLVTAPKVESYKGLIFACLDPEAPSLHDFLGEIGRLSIDYFAMSGEQEIVGPVQKWTVGCNWKFAVDNVWDWYHVTATHSSAGMVSKERMAYVQRWSPTRKPQPELVALGEYGHAIGGARRVEGEQMRNYMQDMEARERLGPVGKQMGGFGGIFPNLW